MKKGFTMIELIFVIVILGILAAVAIPRLAATRDDAEITRAAYGINTAVSDIAAYYTAQGKFADNIANMTSVTLPIKIKGDVCAEFAFNTEKTSVVITKYDNGLCKNMWMIDGLKNMNYSMSFKNIIVSN